MLEMTTVVNLLASVASSVAMDTSGFVDLSRDNNKNSVDATNFLATGEVKGFKLFGSVNSARNGQVLVGRSFALGPYAKTTLYGGVEGQGDQWKARGALNTAAQFGSFGATSVIEVGGVTHTFRQEQLSYTVDKLTLSLVRRSGAGNGLRIDWQATPTLGVYLRSLEHMTTFGFNYRLK